MLKVTMYLTIVAWLVLLYQVEFSSCTIAQPRAPNFQYFESPKYPFPYYDENGVGRLLYGHGGPQLYRYKTYSPIDGIR